MRNNNAMVIGVAALAGLALSAAVSPTGGGAPKKALAAARRRPQQSPAAMQFFAPDAKHPSIPQTLAGGLWRTDGGFQAVMMLRNELDNTPLPVTPVLYMADGTELDLAPVTLGPAGVAMVDINTALASAPATYGGHVSTYGSAAVKSSWPWDPVVAAVRSTDDIRGLIYQMHMDADVNTVSHPKASITQQRLEGAWWKEEPNVKGFLSLTNTTGSAITATAAIGDSTGTNVINQQYQLAPHATTWIDIAPVWQQMAVAASGSGAASSPDAGSIELSYTGAIGAVVANGGMEDASNGYSHMLHFDVPEALQLRERLAALPSHLPGSVPVPTLDWSANTTLDAAGIMVGRQDADMQFPAGSIFKPYLVLRNTTTSAMPVRLSANSMTGGAPQDIPVGALQLAPLETRRVNLAGLLAASSLAGTNGYINLEATYAGSPTDLAETTGSVDQTYNYVFEVPPRPEAPSSPALINYWNANGETDTMITLHNFGSAPQDMVLTLAHQAGKYEMPVHLAAHASVSLILGKLIAEGVPDRKGNVIPANIVQGSAKIMPASGDYHDRNTVAVQFAVFNPRTATCGYSCVTCNSSEYAVFSPDIDQLSVNQGNYLVVYMAFIDGCCPEWGLDNGSSYSNDTSIATFDDDGGVTSTGAGYIFVGGTATAESGDQYCCTGGFCDGQTTYSLSAEVDVTPKILVGLDGNTPSTDITNSSQNVVVGQWVQLQANIGESSASVSWSADSGSTSTRIGGWTPGSAPNDIQANANPTTVYWIVPGTYTVSASVDGQQADATINVSGPTGVLENAVAGAWAITVNNSGSLVLQLAGNVAGIEFASTMSPPAGYGNNLQWVQLITGETLSANGGSCTTSSPTAGLDANYPYPYTALGGDAIDSPDTVLLKGYASEAYGLYAQMYMLWYPNTPGNMPVPLGYIAWNAQGTALQAGGQWTVYSSSVIPSAFTSSSSYPTWSATVPTPHGWSCDVSTTQAAHLAAALPRRDGTLGLHAIAPPPNFMAQSWILRADSLQTIASGRHGRR